MARVIPIAVVVIIATLLGTTPAAADCLRAEPSTDIRDYRGVAFTAWVTTVHRPAPGKPYEITFDVDDVFAGTPPDPVVAIDLGGACGTLRPDELPVGEGGLRLLVATDGLYGSAFGTFGDVLIWRELPDGRWAFFAEALRDGRPRGAHYPPEVWAADGTGEIVALVAPGLLPQTDAAAEGLTRLAPSSHPDPLTRFLAIGFLALAGFGLGRCVSARRS